MVNILGIAFAPSPGRRSSSGQQAFAVLKRENWRPGGARLDLVTAPCRWWGALEVIETQARPDAIVLFGEAPEASAALIARYAHNEARPGLIDAAGQSWAGGRLAPRGPAQFETSMPPDGLARAIGFSGLPAAITDAGDGYIYNRCFYTLLSSGALPAALVRLPDSLESARSEGRVAAANRMQILAGVQAALGFAASFAELAKAA